MSAPTLLFWLVLSGAVLFFAAGYLFRFLQHSDKGPSKKVLQQELELLKQKTRALSKSEQELQEFLADAQRNAEQYMDEASRLDAENRRLTEARLSSVQEPADESPGQGEESEALEPQLISLKKKLGEAKNQSMRAAVSLEKSREEVRKLKRELDRIRKKTSVEENDKREASKLAEKLAAAENQLASMSKVEKENRYLRKEVQLLSSQTTPNRGKGASRATTIRLRQTFDKEMREVVANLLEMDQVRAAVVADIDGTLVGGVGDADTFEGLSSLGGRIGSLGQELGGKCPLDTLRVAHLKDTNDGVAAFRLFQRQGAPCVLATLGSNTPPGEGILELTVSDLTDQV